MRRGHVGIGIFKHSFDVNIGALIRAAAAYGANYVFTIGSDYDGAPTAVGHESHIPVFQFPAWTRMETSLPRETRIVLVEYDEGSYSLPDFNHPERAVYVLGNESFGIPPEYLSNYPAVHIPSECCLNVAQAGNTVLYDRYVSQEYGTPEPPETKWDTIGDAYCGVMLGG